MQYMLDMHKARSSAKNAGALRRHSMKPVAQKGQDVAVPRLATLTHDVRNILAALQLYCDLLEEPGVLSAEHRHYAHELRVVTSTSACFIEELATLTGAGRSHLHMPLTDDAAIPTEIEDVAVALEEIRALLAAAAGPCIELEIECLPCPGNVRLAHQSLKRILINLMRNAAEAMPQGGRVRITVQKGGSASFLQRRPAIPDQSSSSHTVLLCVHDNGPGIPRDNLARIFDMGFTTRAQKTTHDLHRGLGLSIVRNLVEEAGGHIRVLSSPTLGTRFEIELPLTNVTAQTPEIAVGVLQGGLQ